MPSERPQPQKSGMHPPEQLYTPGVVIIAVVDKDADEEMDSRCTNAETAKWTIRPMQHAESEKALKTTPTTAIQTPPGTTNELATMALSQDNSSPTASTSNVPGINATKSIRALHH